MSEKDKTIVVRVSDAERKALEEFSTTLFGSPNKSRLLRKIFREYLALGRDLIPQELELFRDTVRQLSGIARNLNQITQKLHALGVKEYPLTQQLLQQIHGSIEKTNTDLRSYIRKSACSKAGE